MKIACLVLLCLPIIVSLSYAEQYPFDRVFTTQEQRNILDKMRKDKTLYSGQTLQAPLASEQNEKRTIPDAFLVSGIMVRDDGKHVVWIDGKSDITQSHHIKGLNVGKPSHNAKKVRLSAERKTVTAKPGQVWMVTSNSVKENYELKKENHIGREKDSNSVELAEPNEIDAEP